MLSNTTHTFAQTAQPAEGPISAAGGAFDNLFQTFGALFKQGTPLAKPDELMQILGNLSAIWGLIFLVTGLITMLNGYRWHKAIVITMAVALGGMIGYWIGGQLGAQTTVPLVLAGCFSLLLAVLAWPLMKYAAAVMGGLTGAFLGANAWAAAAAVSKVPENTYWVGALFGLLILGMLAFMVFKFSVEVFTSVSGATIATLGAIALLLSFSSTGSPVESTLTSSKAVLPIVVLTAAGIGLAVQEIRSKPSS